MKPKQIAVTLITMLAAFGSGVLAGSGLSSKDARQLIATMNGLELSPDDVHIRRLDMGFSGKDAVVEALVQIAFKFTQQNGHWSVTHVRTGDRQWESVELVTTAVRAEKIKRTGVDLREVAQALDAYRRDHEVYPQAPTFSALIDALLPTYLSRVIREDYWHQSYVYTPAPNGYRIFSVGPDGKQGTDDDIVIENGELISPVEG
ncbi:MAG: type II secretion system protein GspG [Acidobacteria bacterium]|nr:type II secretion system protein GspG [Acidobacteriota bacterium]